MSKFKKVNVAGDGACYFHAVVGFLDMERLVKDKKTYYKKGLDKEASDLRKKVVTWLRNNLTFQYENELTIKDDIEDEIRNNSKYSLSAVIYVICLDPRHMPVKLRSRQLQIF